MSLTTLSDQSPVRLAHRCTGNKQKHLGIEFKQKQKDWTDAGWRAVKIGLLHEGWVQHGRGCRRDLDIALAAASAAPTAGAGQEVEGDGWPWVALHQCTCLADILEGSAEVNALAWALTEVALPILDCLAPLKAWAISARLAAACTSLNTDFDLTC